MTETARVYGGSLYELAQEEHLEEEILSENSADARKRFSADTLRRTTLPRQL